MAHYRHIGQGQAVALTQSRWRYPLAVWAVLLAVWFGYEASAVLGNRPRDDSRYVASLVGARACQMTGFNVNNPQNGEKLRVYNCFKGREKACDTIAGPIPVALADRLFGRRIPARRPFCAI